MRALVTGGSGFVGSHLVDALVGRGDPGTVVDDSSSTDRANLTLQLTWNARHLSASTRSPSEHLSRPAP
jgi:nucleoside-diphosphate-sugar epimerase